MINITTPNIPLVLKLHPSEELTLLVLLGYQNYPTEENHVAKVTLPQQGDSQGESYDGNNTNGLLTMGAQTNTFVLFVIYSYRRKVHMGTGPQ